MEHNQ